MEDILKLNFVVHVEQRIWDLRFNSYHRSQPEAKSGSGFVPPLEHPDSAQWIHKTKMWKSLALKIDELLFLLL
jgi:hypothetical protein